MKPKEGPQVAEEASHQSMPTYSREGYNLLSPKTAAKLNPNIPGLHDFRV